MKNIYALLLVLVISAVHIYPQFPDDKSNIYPRLLTAEVALDDLSKIIGVDKLDSLLTSIMETRHIAGLAALIVKHDSIVWSRNYGYSNIALNRPVEDSTLFQTASISKTIMITALMQLWEDGLFDLEDNINDYLQPDFQVINPQYPNDIITFKMLMTHTSSIDDNWNILTPLEICDDSPITLDSILANYYTPGGVYYSGLNFFNYPPNSTNFHYTNAGSCILALIVEKLSGLNFPQYCRQKIFNQLNMNKSSWFLSGLDTTNIATPYEWIGGQFSAICHEGWPLYPIAFLRTNKIELEHFLSMYRNWGTYNGNTLLDSTTVDTMLTVYKYVDPYNSWGLIWFQILLNNQYLWGHTGGWDGISTAMYFLPEEDWGAIMFMNSNTDDQGFWGSFEMICRYAHLYGNIYAIETNINERFMRPSVDTLTITTRFENIYQHSFTANAVIISSDSSFIDSTAFYDDGQHGDSLANDGFWGAFVHSISEEKIFSIGISTKDLDNGEYFYTGDQTRFATAGPVVLDSIQLTKVSLPPRSYRIKPFIRNLSGTASLTNITTELISDDPWIEKLVPGCGYPVLPPGVTVTSTGAASVVYIDSLFPGYFNFRMKIKCNEWTYWTDSIKVIVGVEVEEAGQLTMEYNLDQNYPNPFNPVTKIKYSVPQTSLVQIKVFDVLGNEIETLVNEEKPAGTYELTWNAENLPSGVYFYQLRAGDFVQTKKMILMK